MRLLLFSCFLLPLLAMAQWEVAPVFSDGMMLQRNQPIRIWGKGVPGTSVSVQFSGMEKSTTVQPDSSWMLVLPKLRAQAQPQSMVLTCGDRRREFHDILIGDVWICTGQSNMEWPMQRESHWKEERNQCNRPLIRFLNPPPAGRNVYGVPYTDSLLQRLTPERFYGWNGWQVCDSNTVRSMSAVGYYFAKRITLEEGIPVGLINLSVGGAPLETFISIRALSMHPVFREKVHGNWLNNDSLPVWVRERGRQNIGGIPAAPGDEYGPHHAYKPGFAFAAGIQPLRHFPVKGVLVYQGESNAEEPNRVHEYKELFKLLVHDYRNHWNNPQLPVYWVQLSSIERPLWPLFRNAQRELLDEVKYGGMAVTSD
ncbi:MAG: sialate O-acetylesterase, partial [Chitinophagaceae bacterium]|nr:sialate O-acetylesterase [Chitinophagaceae bacterium]